MSGRKMSRTGSRSSINCYPAPVPLRRSVGLHRTLAISGIFERRLGYDFERLNSMGLEYYGKTPGGLPFTWSPANLKSGSSSIVWPITGWGVTGPLPGAGHWQVVPGAWNVHFNYQTGSGLRIGQ